MTKVNVHFGSPEPYFGLELNEFSQEAFDTWKALEDEDDTDEAWETFLQAFDAQVRPMIGNRGYVEEVYEDYEED